MDRQIAAYQKPYPTPEEIAAGIARGRLLHARAVRGGFSRLFVVLLRAPRRMIARTDTPPKTGPAAGQRA